MAGLLWYRSYMDSLSNTSGYYPDIHAGHADRVTELTLDAPYLVRETPAGYNQLELAQIIGGTMVVEGSLQSVEATAHVTVGKNLFDIARTIDVPSPSDILASPRVMSTDKFYLGLRSDNYYYPNYIANYSVSDGVIKVTTRTNNSYGLGFPIKCESDTQYTLSCSKNNANMGVGCYDADWNYISRLVSLTSDESATFTTPSNAEYITLIFSSLVLMEEGTITNIQLERGSSATTYVPYVKHTTPLANITLRGISKTVDGVLSYDGDTYDPDGTVTRYYGERAYQAGDESLTDAVTDGTVTVYKLSTPVTESAAPYTATQTVEEGGTVEFVTSNNIPVGNVSIYRRV